MFAPFTRSMTFTLGLFSVVVSPDLLAETDPENKALELGATSITAEGLGATTEHTGAYTTSSMSTATRLNLSVKDTPQSISVITRQQMDDFNLNTLTDALRQTTGVTVQHLDSDRAGYSSRGYSINNFQVDGMLNTFGRMKSDSDTIIYDPYRSGARCDRPDHGCRRSLGHGQHDPQAPDVTVASQDRRERCQP